MSIEVLDLILGFITGVFIVLCLFSNDVLSAVKYGFMAIYCFIAFAMGRIVEKIIEVLREER